MFIIGLVEAGPVVNGVDSGGGGGTWKERVGSLLGTCLWPPEYMLSEPRRRGQAACCSQEKVEVYFRLRIAGWRRVDSAGQLQSRDC